MLAPEKCLEDFADPQTDVRHIQNYSIKFSRYFLSASLMEKAVHGHLTGKEI